MMKKYTLYLLALMMFLPSLARADIHASAGCSSTQINAAISAAVDGDTVTVPACAETAWDADVTIPNTKGITLQGNGLASTYINTNSHTLTINTLSTNQKVRVTGFNFVRTDSDDIIYIDGTAQDWRIDHNAINGGASAYGGYLVRIWNYTYGLIDANTFTNYSIAIQHRWNDSRDTARGGDYVWSLPAQRGTVQAVYIENNTFTGADDPLQTVDGSFGVKYVTRYNNNNNPAEHSHSGCTPGGRNAIWVEHYNNAYTDDANRSYAPVWFRSVSGIVANNTFAADMVGTAVLIDHERGWRTDCTEAAGAKNETCDGTRAYDQNTADQHGYICRGQPG